MASVAIMDVLRCDAV